MANSASSSRAPILQRPPGIVKLNDSVWKLYSPPSIEEVPEVDIVFFHGLQLADSQEAFWRTWLSRDKTVAWPQEWLSERFPKARILSISYESSHWKREGQLDPNAITDNLIQNIIQDARVGQNCQVVLVGHSFGGIIIKKVILGCNRMSVEMNRATCQLELGRLNKFLDNCKGVFYYSTPHTGSVIADYASRIPGINESLMNLLKTLSRDTAKINESFANVRINRGIRTEAIVESLTTSYWGFSAKVVEEASARHDIDGILYTAPQANHFEVCQPKDKTTCCIFGNLSGSIDEMLQSTETTPVLQGGDQCQGLPDYPIELESRAHDIEELLKGNAVLGISGMGGVGKTTLAKTVYNRISNHFEYACFAENVKVISDLKDWLLRHFHKSGTGMDGSQRQWSDFQGKKTLIIMDDVDSENQLKVLPKLHDLGEHSRIIITSRDEGISEYYHNSLLYRVDFLNEDEAKKLFCQHAFGKEEIPDHVSEWNHFKENVEAVVKKCGGLPLTVEVIGNYLRNEMNPKVWEETIDKLTKAQAIGGEQDDKVWARLKVSYETLAGEEQQMFIEAGTYFFGKELIVAFAAWSTTIGYTESRWKNLERRSLVKAIEGKVWVHEHLRDLSWNLAEGVIISGSDEKAAKLLDQLNSIQVNTKAKALDLSAAWWDRTLRLKCLRELKELKYLTLDRVYPEGSGKNLPRTLSLLRWNSRYDSKSRFPISLTRMNNLSVLELAGWDVPKGFPEALGHLTNLRYLSLSRLKGLDRLPENFGKLSCLKHLYLKHLRLPSLPKSFGDLLALENLELEDLDVSELPASFGNLCSLINLTIDSCDKLASLPSSFGCSLTCLKRLHIRWCPLLQCLPPSFSLLPRLQEFSLRYCRALKELGESFGSISTLEELNLYGSGIERLPHSFSKLSRLQRLSLKGCRSLKELVDSFGNLNALKYLDLGGSRIERLPRSFGLLSALEELTCEFDQASMLPENFCLLTSLRNLSIKSDSLERLPESLGELARVEELKLKVHNVNALPPSFGKLFSLRTLRLSSKKLEKLPDSFLKLSSLENLEIEAKSSVGMLTSIGRISSLRTLTVHAIEKLDEQKRDSDDTVEGIGRLHSLRELNLKVASIRCLPESMEQLTALRKVVFHCDGYKRLPDHFDHLPFPSVSLELEGHDRLPEGIGRLASLEELRLHFPNSESFPEELGNLSSLRKLTIDWCGTLQSVPNSLGHLSSLIKLNLEGCKSLQSLPDSLGGLSSLRKFELSICESLQSLPDSLGSLSSLRKLLFYDCKSLQSLPDSLGGLSSLRKLELSKCESLQSLPDSLGGLSSLRKLELFHCTSLQSLPDSLGGLSSLRELKLWCCECLQSLPASLGSLSSLRELNLWSCKSLKAIPNSLGRPASSRLVLPQGERTNEEEPSFQTTTTETNTRELSIFVDDCHFLNDSTMRRLGWLVFERGSGSDVVAYRRKRPDNHNIPLEPIIESTRTLCYMVISLFVLQKVYTAFRSK